jgi:hypothetical protein
MAGARFYSYPAFFCSLFGGHDGFQGLLAGAADAVTRTSVTETVAAGVGSYTTECVPQSSVRFSANDTNNWSVIRESNFKAEYIDLCANRFGVRHLARGRRRLHGVQ